MTPEKLEQIEKIRAFYKLCEVPYLYELLIEEAITSEEWDFMNPDDFDGCTGAPELHYDGYPFDCLVHDFHWKTGRGGLISDKIFKDNMKFMGRSKSIIRKRFFAVRTAWLSYFKWKHKFAGNVHELTPAMKMYRDIKGTF